MQRHEDAEPGRPTIDPARLSRDSAPWEWTRYGAVFPDTVIAQLDRSYLAKYLPARLLSNSARHPEKAKASASAQ